MLSLTWQLLTDSVVMYHNQWIYKYRAKGHDFQSALQTWHESVSDSVAVQTLCMQ